MEHWCPLSRKCDRTKPNVWIHPVLYGVSNTFRTCCGSICRHSWSCLLAAVSLNKQRVVVLCCALPSLHFLQNGGETHASQCTVHFNQWYLTCIYISDTWYKCHRLFATVIFNIKHLYGISQSTLCEIFHHILVGFRELWTIVSGFHEQ